ncbi:MAG TPA: site-2 protease family protein [Clostridiales bacterium]|jgi:Zn-dependent protease|nr:site-2 protease family protein [Clostridiales bacterium]
MIRTLFGSGFSRESIIFLLLSLPVILFSLSLHETAHGYVAYKLGDRTAYNLGRLTLNPVKHLDPIGFLMMMLAGFGWAKPVPINTRNFKNPRVGMALTGAAGPLSNLLFALLNAVFLRLSYEFLWLSFGGGRFTIYIRILMLLFFIGISLNTTLAVFNLLPVPPLDGSRIFYVFLPAKLYFGIMKYERVISIVLIFLLFFGVLSGMIFTLSDIFMRGMFYITGLSLQDLYNIQLAIFS